MKDLDITGSHVHYVVRHIQGNAGPGGCDSSHWQDILLRCGISSSHLRDSIANLTRCLANAIIEWPLLQGLLTSRLIALDKCPEIRPIGIGEVFRRVIG